MRPYLKRLRNFLGKHAMVAFFCFFAIVFLYFGFLGPGKISYSRITDTLLLPDKKNTPDIPPLDRIEYDRRMSELANIPIPLTSDLVNPNVPTPKPPIWPAKAVYPNAGAILPFNRIVAYYGNLYSTKMGALGEYPRPEMLSRLNTEVKKWNEADPGTPALPALHYIVVTAQLSPGEDGKYRLRMPDKEIDKVLDMAEEVGAIVFLDFQVAFSTLQAELPRYEKYLKLPNVHLGIDPEFSMKNGIRPGKVVGTFDADDINFAAQYLARLVKENNLTPKVLVIHRYTEKMVTNYKQIMPLPEVQIVMHMDGWGGKAKKINTYKQFVALQPVQFTGFKIFYKNDVLGQGDVLITPGELMKLSPRPSYIQYQ